MTKDEWGALAPAVETELRTRDSDTWQVAAGDYGLSCTVARLGAVAVSVCISRADSRGSRYWATFDWPRPRYWATFDWPRLDGQGYGDASPMGYGEGPPSASCRREADPSEVARAILRLVDGSPELIAKANKVHEDTVRYRAEKARRVDLAASPTGWSRQVDRDGLPDSALLGSYGDPVRAEVKPWGEDEYAFDLRVKGDNAMLAVARLLSELAEAAS